MRSRGCLNTPGFVLAGKTGIGEVDRLQNVVPGPDLTDIGQIGAKITALLTDSMAGGADRPVSKKIPRSPPTPSLTKPNSDPSRPSHPGPGTSRKNRRGPLLTSGTGATPMPSS